MSVINNFIDGLTRSEPTDPKSVRNIGWVFLLVGIGSFLYFLLNPIINEIGKIKIDNVTAKNIELPPATFSTTEFGNYGYVNEKVLFYEPKSFIDYLAFNSIGGLNMLDFIFFLYVGIVLFNALKKVEENNTFRLKISTAYRKIGKGCLLMFLLTLTFKVFFIRNFLSYRTKGQFTIAQDEELLFFIYFLVGMIILSCVYFMNKGEALQQDNDLTI